MSGRVLVLDFDGTVCVGDGPVLRYAEEVDAHLGVGLPGLVVDFLAGRVSGGAAQDAYQLVQQVAAGHGLAADRVGRAYLAGRDALAAGEVEIATPRGLAAMLADLRPQVHVVVHTNAPQQGLGVLIEKLGLADVIDEALGDAGKPTGMVSFVERELARFGIVDQPWRLLSVGDLWSNDLAAPVERGCATAYIDRFDLRQGPADARAATCEELYDDVRHWRVDAHAFVRRTVNSE